MLVANNVTKEFLCNKIFPDVVEILILCHNEELPQLTHYT
jgi:hypothetical protein